MTATWTTPRTWATGEIVTAALLNAHLRDNIDWLKGRPYYYEADFDGTVFTSSSTSFVDTGIGGALVTTGGRVRIEATIAMSIVTGPNTCWATLYQDGVNLGDATVGMTQSIGQAQALVALSFVTPTAPSAASHTYEIRVRGTGTLITVVSASIFVYEPGV